MRHWLRSCLRTSNVAEVADNVLAEEVVVDRVISLGVRMANYCSVISRSVAALEINTFEERRAIYNRARALQSYQLGKRPFNKADFDRERSMLEDAISRVEIEATTEGITTEASPSESTLLSQDIGVGPMSLGCTGASRFDMIVP